MSDPVSAEILARDQLSRMRGMTAMYHRQFFADVRFTLVVMLALFGLGWWEIEELFLVVPFVAIWGGCQTAFDASYLIFARQYAASLERWLNRRIDPPILLAARLEDAYLFPLDQQKIVTVAITAPPTWFGFMTLFTTTGGLVAAATGLWAGNSTLISMTFAARTAYFGALAGLTAVALVVGVWWFVAGVGERRLRGVLDPVFGERR